MKKPAVYWIVPVSLIVMLGLSALAMWPRGAADFAAAISVDRPPQIHPDYSDMVIPPNIAPLNFSVEEPGTKYAVQVRSAQGGVIEVISRIPQIVIPLSRWHELLGANRGGKLYFDVYVRRTDGQWVRFEPIVNTIADADIDGYLFYRLIGPIYIQRKNVGVYQRNLQTYRESVVVSNRWFKGGCVNCHAFAPQHSDRMIVHSRGFATHPEWNGMIVVRDGKITKVDTRDLACGSEAERGRIKKAPAGSATWHPGGNLAVFSANHITQFFHAVGDNRDAFDAESDLALYHMDLNTVTTTPEISRPDRLETFPTWSPDGRYLYFCSGDPLPQERYTEVRYDLMRISYEPESDSWGEVEPVLLAKDTGLTITEPRVSPDGRWLLFCMSAYGCFPAFQESSDLYLLNLETRRYHRLTASSPRSESWHCWSSNSRWIAFSSKRRDGIFSRVYFSYIDEQGRARKPVLLPQKDPTFYDRFIRIYNLPELARAPAPASARSLARVIRSRVAAGVSDGGAAANMQGMDFSQPKHGADFESGTSEGRGIGP